MSLSTDLAQTAREAKKKGASFSQREGYPLFVIGISVYELKRIKK